MINDPKFHRGQVTEPARRSLTATDLLDIAKALESVLQRTGVTPSPPIDLEGQQKLGLQTLLQEARRAAALLARLTVEVDGKPTYPYGKSAAQLSMVVDGVEKEWRL